jgi:hypothetical protein
MCRSWVSQRTSLRQNPLYLAVKVFEQLGGSAIGVGNQPSAAVDVPMIELGSPPPRAVGIIEPVDAPSGGIVQRQAVFDPVRPDLASL